MNWLGLDIGGANLKLADGKGYATEQSFPLWKAPDQLATVMEAMFRTAPSADALAITMTGELADCYRTKNEGVRHILQAVCQVAGTRSLRVYRTGGSFVTVQDAMDHPQAVAASNWHALATWASRILPTLQGLLIDIGSTTTDIVPLLPGQVSACGSTDTERLALGELVYTGIRRTAVATLVSSLPYRGEMCSVARENFATTGDVYLTLRQLDEDDTNCDTADGRPATRCEAHRRLARMLCADVTEVDANDAYEIALAVKESQLQTLEHAIEKVRKRHPEMMQTALISGSGEFLARELLQRKQPEMPVISLSDYGSLPVSKCAPAHALAVLARERCG